MDKLKKQVNHWLIWSEKYTKTDMIYLGKGSFWLSITQMIVTGTSFILSITMANLLSPEILGTYRFIISMVGVISSFTLTGMAVSITRSVARGYSGALKQGFLVQLKWSSIMVAVSLGYSIYYTLAENYTLAIAFILIAIFSPIIQSTSLFSAFLEGMKDFRTETLYNSIRNIVPVASLVLTVFITDNLLFILGVYFISNAIANVICYLLTISKYKPEKKIEDETIGYGKHLSLMNVVPNIALYIDKILIFYFLGPVQVAIYAIAQAPVEQLRGLNKILNRLSFPKLSQKSFGELKKSLGMIAFKLTLIMLSIAVLYILCAPFLYKIIFPQYIESVIYSQIYAMLLILLPTTLFGQALTAHARKKELYIAKTSTPLLNIILLAILLPIYGLMGAILAILLSRLFNAIIVTYLFYSSND